MLLRREGHEGLDAVHVDGQLVTLDRRVYADRHDDVDCVDDVLAEVATGAARDKIRLNITQPAGRGETTSLSMERLRGR